MCERMFKYMPTAFPAPNIHISVKMCVVISVRFRTCFDMWYGFQIKFHICLFLEI